MHLSKFVYSEIACNALLDIIGWPTSLFNDHPTSIVYLLAHTRPLWIEQLQR